MIAGATRGRSGRARVRDFGGGATVLRARGLAFRVHGRSVAVSVVVLVVLVAAVVLALSMGRPYVAPQDVVRSLLDGGTPYDVVVRRLRLPRVVLGVFVGACFGVAGALIQSVARNPLASPDVIGITQGAGLAATIALTAGATSAVIAPSALAGGLVAAIVVLALGARHGLAAQRFVLAGVAVAIALRALTEIVMLSADPIDGQRAQLWLIGTLAGLGWRETTWLVVALVVLLPVLLWAGWALHTSALDDDTARGLGVRPSARRGGLALVGVVLAAIATAQVGAVDFVALVAPQVARRLARAERPPLLAAALTGALLVVLADLTGRLLFAPAQLPAGVVTAAIGGPYLLFLLVRRRT